MTVTIANAAMAISGLALSPDLPNIGTNSVNIMYNIYTDFSHGNNRLLIWTPNKENLEAENKTKTYSITVEFIYNEHACNELMSITH